MRAWLSSSDSGKAKVEYARGLVPYRRIATIQRKLLAYSHWFNAHRPHQGLGQRTPDEVFYGRYARANLVPLHAALEANLIDGDQSLPVLRLRCAA